ncbi:MAG: glycosyltransferase family 2 protein [Microgenomates group bacterium]
MDLSIIIVSFNVGKLLKECIESILKNKNELSYEIIIVDNASTDNSVKIVKKLGVKELRVIENKKNLGFAKAVNQGIKKARGDYILLLNPDTKVKPGSLKNLLSFAKSHPDVGVIGAKLINPDGSIQSSVYHFPSLWRAFKEFWLGEKGAYEKYTPLGEKPLEVDAVTGAVMLISRKTIKKIGLFDERYFMYFEDLDYCRRVKKAGLKIYYLPTVKILHHHGQSAKKVGDQARKWLVKSSKIYNGIIKYWLLTFIIWSGQKWRKILKKIKMK